MDTPCERLEPNTERGERLGKANPYETDSIASTTSVDLFLGRARGESDSMSVLIPSSYSLTIDCTMVAIKVSTSCLSLKNDYLFKGKSCLLKKAYKSDS